MKEVLTIFVAIVVGLCINGFEIRNSNKLLMKEEIEKQTSVEIEIEEMVKSLKEKKTKVEYTAESNDDLGKHNEGEPIEKTTVKEQRSESSTKKQQTEKKRKKQENTPKNSKPNSIEKNLDSSTTFNIEDAGTGSWGQLTDADMEALGL